MLSVIVNRLAQTMLMYVLSKCVCDASLVTVPKSSVAVIGDRVELKCSSNSDKQVTWAFAPTNTATDAEFYFGDNISLPFRLRYTIDNSVTGQHDLIINSVDLEHAGKYSCIQFASDNKAIAFLTVLGSSPKCSINTSSTDNGVRENDYLWMSCYIVYTGDMIPIFSWTTSKADDAIASATSTTDNSKLPITTNSSIIRKLHSDDNGVTFKCNIRFRHSSNSEGNAPEYEYAWNYTVKVLYGPRNLSIVREGDRLECSADGNPTPNYTWTHVGTNRPTFKDGALFNLDGIYDRESTFQCTATNIVANETKNITLQGPETSHRTVVAAAIGGGSLLILLIIVVISCFVSRRKLKGLTMKHATGVGRSVLNEPDIIDVDIYAYDDVVFNREPPSEHEQNGFNALRVVENHGAVSESIPVYAEVKIGKGGEERRKRNANCSSPASASDKTKKKANESLNVQSYAAFGLNEDHSQTHQLPNQKKKGQSIVGADGTEYLDLSEVKLASNVSTTRAATPPTFTSMNYAFIDHTARAPPPPPKL